MYLKHVYISNGGPITDLELTPQFRQDGTPKPIVIVGSNGSGKTSLLSTIADALLELQVRAHYTDILPINKAGNRYFYRLLGGGTTAIGKSFQISVLKFQENEQPFHYRASAGQVPPEIQSRFAEYALLSGWGPENTKQTGGDEKELAKIFRSQAHLFFPSGRSESAWWQSLRPEVSAEARFAQNLQSELGKPLVLPTSFDRINPWLVDVILDQSVDIMTIAAGFQGKSQEVAIRELQNAANLHTTLQSIGAVLSKILGRPARIVKAGRAQMERKIQIADELGSPIIMGLNALSTGQAALLAVFLNIIRYGDLGQVSLSLDHVSGIVLVDEIDAHLHADLQHDVLPQLIKMFPRVQFIVSSHSPLFALGMDENFGENEYSLIELPSGLTIKSERFNEFIKSFEYYKNARLFQNSMSRTAAAGARPQIIFEGETDPIYFKRAAELLGYASLVKQIEFDWIGSKQGGSGTRGGGSGALDNAVKLFKDNPSILHMPIALVYDCDTPRDYHQENLLVCSIAQNMGNSIRRKGVENLLPESVFVEDFWKTETINSDDPITKRTLQKVALCRHLCQESAAEIFVLFRPTLEKLREFFEASGAIVEVGISSADAKS